ncbi:MAG TPA: proteinase IV [Clostridiales bacterium]|nr:proteinase IV [Clostridiales bacterium]
MNMVQAQKQDQVVMGNTKFAVEIFKVLNREDKDKNIFISPLSISTALTMTLNGADSTTKEAMQEALFYKGLSMEEINSGNKYLYQYLMNMDKRVAVDIANSIWIKEGYPIKQPFIDINKDMFDAYVTELDFSKAQAADEINNWISDSTKGLIDRMIDPPIPADVVMYLINAIYFKGDWTVPFEEKKTFEKDFRGLYETSKVDMMRRKGDVEYYSNDRLKAVRLPYGKSEAYSMYAILPDEESDINTLIEEFDINTWEKIRNGVKGRDEFELQIPKFTMEYGIKELKEALTELGMGEAFSGGADFLLMSDNGLMLDNVLHKAKIEVNEKGSTAAAATVVVVKESAKLDNEFIADRPFLFVIADQTDGNILFMGKMISP